MSGTKCAVLLVEDHADIREATAELLRSEGYVVRTAEDGASALDSLRREPSCGVVILDWRLPDIEGGEVLRVVRADPRLAGMPVIVVSADNVTPERVRAAGGTACLRKPVAPDALLETLTRHMPCEQLVELPDVRCLGRGVPCTHALVCRVGGKEVTIFVDDIQETSEVRQPGDYGTLVIPLWVAVGLGVARLNPLHAE